MALNLAQYIILVKRYLDESTTNTQNRLFPDDEITAALNAAQQEVCVELATTRSFFRTTVSIDLTTGDMSVPDDYLTGLGCTFVPGTSTTDRRRMPILDQGTMNDQYPAWLGVAAVQYPFALVQNFGPDGITLRSYPQPTNTISSALYLDYVQMPDDMAASDDESVVMALFPPHLQRRLLPYGALREMALYEGGECDPQFAKWDNLFQIAITDVHKFLNSAFRPRLRYGAGWQ